MDADIQSIIDQEVNKLKGGTDGISEYGPGGQAAKKRGEAFVAAYSYAEGWSDWRWTYGSLEDSDGDAQGTKQST